MSSFNPLEHSDERLRDVVRTTNDMLRDSIGPANVTLQVISDKIFEEHGVRLDTSEIAKYLSQTMNAKRAGVSSTTTAYGTAAADAARASQNAQELETDSSHHAAASLHNLAAEACHKAMTFHLKKAAWHSDKANGLQPEEMEAE